MKCIFALILSLSLLACSTNTTKAPDNVINKPFPKVQGTKEELMAIERALESGDVATFTRIEHQEEDRIDEQIHHHD